MSHIKTTKKECKLTTTGLTYKKVLDMWSIEEEKGNWHILNSITIEKRERHLESC